MVLVFWDGPRKRSVTTGIVTSAPAPCTFIAFHDFLLLGSSQALCETGKEGKFCVPLVDARNSSDVPGPEPQSNGCPGSPQNGMVDQWPASSATSVWMI